MANKKGSRQLTWTDRISIEALKKAGHSVIEIAEQLGVHRSTIYNELKRGEYMHRNSDYTETLSYSPNKAQMKAEENLKARGTQLKIGNDIAYANYIEDKIVNEDYSPAAVLGELKAQGKEGDFSVTVCVTTLYSYIDKGILDCQHFFRQIFLGYFSDIVQAFDTLRKNVCGDDYTSLHNPIVLSSVLLVYGMFHSTQILF